MHQKRLVTALFIGLFVLTAGIAAPVAAQESDIIDDFESNEDSSTISMVLATADGLTDRALYWASDVNPLSDDPEPSTAVSNDAKELRHVVNNNSSAIQTYVNDRFSGNASEWNVIEITHKREGASTTHYLVAGVNSTSGDFENVSMVNSTSRTVDRSLVLEDYASDQAAAEMKFFVKNYVKQDKNVSGEYISRIASKYKGHYKLPESADGGS